MHTKELDLCLDSRLLMCQCWCDWTYFGDEPAIQSYWAVTSVNHINPKMDLQKMVTLDGFMVHADTREHFVKNATLSIMQKILTGRLTVKVLQTFEAVQGSHGPRISILGLNFLAIPLTLLFRGFRNWSEWMAKREPEGLSCLWERLPTGVPKRYGGHWSYRYQLI